MNFLEEPTSGHVYIDGQELTAKNKTKLVRETTSMVFQQFNLYPHMTVLKNLTLAPMKLHHKTKQEAEELPQHKRHPLWIEQPMGDGRESRPGCGLYKKRKSDDPCRWVIAFLVPCGTGRVNDKKVNEENSKVKNKSVCGAEVAAPKRGCIQVSLLLDTTYHFGTEIARGFLKFLPKNTREIAFL